MSGPELASALRRTADRYQQDTISNFEAMPGEAGRPDFWRAACELIDVMVARALRTLADELEGL